MSNSPRQILRLTSALILVEPRFPDGICYVYCLKNILTAMQKRHPEAGAHEQKDGE
jgi:hypothetical protein